MDGEKVTNNPKPSLPIQMSLDAKKKLGTQKVKYEEAMNMLSIYVQKKAAIESEYKRNPSNYLKSLLANLDGLCFEWESNTDILRSSLLNQIFFSGKLGLQAILAKSIFKCS